MSVGAAPYSLLGADPVAAAFDRAEHLRNDDAALDAAWPTACVLAIGPDGAAASDDTGAPRIATGATFGERPADASFLGLDGAGRAWFAASRDDTPRIDLRTAAATWPVREASAFATAHALHHWQARHRYCGTCGGEVAFVRGGWLGRCLRCAREHYPRTDPAVIVAVGAGNRLLMGRQAAWPARRYSVIAGFVEPGETLEQAAAREVQEETGIVVTRCRYLGSQPWPMPTSLMIGFIAEGEHADVRCTDELETARWFDRADVLAALDAERNKRTDDAPFLLPSRISIAHWLVREWLASTA